MVGFVDKPANHLLALASGAVGADRGGAGRALLYARVVVEVPGISAADARGTGCTIVANSAVVPSDRLVALAGVAIRIDPVGAGERRAALSAIVASGYVRDQPVKAVAGVDAPVFVKEFAAVAPSAVLAMLAGLKVADAARCGGVLVRGAFAAVGDVHATDAPCVAGERHHAPALVL